MSLNQDLEGLIEIDTPRARALIAQMIADLPRSVEARLLMAQCHVRRLEFTEALPHYRAAAALDPRNDAALNWIGFCHLCLGEHAAALEAYQTAFRTLSNARALRFGALLQHRLGRLNEAAEAYGRLVRTAQPTSAEIPLALQGLSSVMRDLGRPVAADAAMAQLLERFARDPVTLASALSARNNSEDFHEWARFADKAHLGAALTRRGAVDPGARVPETFILPRDRVAFSAFARSPAAPALYIVKPVRSSGGRGITVVADPAEALDREDVVVQRYIDRPFLVDGRKGHARIYGFVTSVDPVRAYVFSEGIIRFAPDPYDPRPDAPGAVSMHVTNTALHVGNPRLVINQDPKVEDQGAIWSLSAYLRRMTADGLDGSAVFAEIKALVEWFIRMLIAEGVFQRQAAHPRRAYAPKLFGLDVLIDADGHPWLIEMQKTPAAQGAPLVNRISAELFETAFRMTHGPLLDDRLSPAQIEAIRSDPQALAAREAEIEAAGQGRFVRLDL